MTITERADIFIMMFEMLVMTSDPYEYAPGLELRVAVEPSCRPHIPEKFIEEGEYFEYVDLMTRCWNHDPAKRPSANDCLAEIRGILEKLEVGGVPALQVVVAQEEKKPNVDGGDGENQVSKSDPPVVAFAERIEGGGGGHRGRMDQIMEE